MTLEDYAGRAAEIWPAMVQSPKVFNDIPARHRGVMALRHDLWTFSAIASFAHISKGRVQQIFGCAISRMDTRAKRRAIRMAIVRSPPPSDAEADFGFQSWTPQQQFEEFNR